VEETYEHWYDHGEGSQECIREANRLTGRRIPMVFSCREEIEEPKLEEKEDNKNAPEYGKLAGYILKLLWIERDEGKNTLREHLLQKIWDRTVCQTMGPLRHRYDENYNDPRPALTEEQVQKIVFDVICEDQAKYLSTSNKVIVDLMDKEKYNE